jgi:hypothetical protein
VEVEHLNEDQEKENPWLLFLVLGGLLAFALAIFAFNGCTELEKDRRDRADSRQRYSDFQEVASAINRFYAANGNRYPANIDELKQHLTDKRIEDQIRNGEIEVIWNAASNNQKDTSSKVVLAWYSTADASGDRPVLFMDSSVVDLLMEQDFKAALKATTLAKKTKEPQDHN